MRHSPDSMKGGMPVSVFDLMTLIEYTITIFQLGVAYERNREHKNSRPHA